MENKELVKAIVEKCSEVYADIEDAKKKLREVAQLLAEMTEGMG